MTKALFLSRSLQSLISGVFITFLHQLNIAVIIMTKIWALILAGGQSTRMGQDKALVLWENVPLLRRVGLVAASSTDRVLILTPWPHRYGWIMESDWQFLIEEQLNQGPLVGLLGGLNQIVQFTNPPEWILLLACDLPCLNSEILSNWRQRLSSLDPKILAFIPHDQNNWEPLCGFYRIGVLPSLAEFVDANNRSFQGWLNQLPVQRIETDRESRLMLKNCNTPADLI